MKTFLSIRNFFSLSNADIEIKPLTILLGENGSGKTLLMHLCYFFETSVKYIKLEKDLNYCIKLLHDKFNDIFKIDKQEKSMFKDTKITYIISDNDQPALDIQVKWSDEKDCLDWNIMVDDLDKLPLSQPVFMPEHRSELMSLPIEPEDCQGLDKEYLIMKKFFLKIFPIVRNDLKNRFYDLIGVKDIVCENDELIFIAKNDSKLTINQLSSGQKAMASLLPMLCSKGGTAYFDNIENGLHPGNQVELMKHLIFMLNGRYGR